MFQFPGLAPCGLCVHPQVTPSACTVTTGCPIRRSPDQRLFDTSPGLIAACHVLHRLSTPRHPPCTLSSLATFMNPCQDPCTKPPSRSTRPSRPTRNRVRPTRRAETELMVLHIRLALTCSDSEQVKTVLLWTCQRSSRALVAPGLHPSVNDDRRLEATLQPSHHHRQDPDHAREDHHQLHHVPLRGNPTQSPRLDPLAAVRAVVSFNLRGHRSRYLEEPRPPSRLASGRTRSLSWWRRPGSNRQPPACKAGALPVELRPRPKAHRPLAGSFRSAPPDRHSRLGPAGFEPATSPLSGARSNQLSYEPLSRAPQPKGRSNDQERKGHRLTAGGLGVTSPCPPRSAIKPAGEFDLDPNHHVQKAFSPVPAPATSRLRPDPS